MLIRFVFLLVVFAALAPSASSQAQTRDSTAQLPPAIAGEITRIQTAARIRDSLTALADRSSGASRALIEELIWQRHVEVHKGVQALAERVKAEQKRGADITAVRQALDAAVREGWPTYLAQLQRREEALMELNKAADSASGAERVSIESEATHQTERLLEAFDYVVEDLVVLERAGIDVTEQRAFLVRGLRLTANGLVTRVHLVSRDKSTAGSRLSRDVSNADLRYTFEASTERLKRATRSLDTAIRLMSRLGLDTTELRVAEIAMTGRITMDVFDWRVLVGLLKALWRQFVEFLASKALHWVFQGLVIVLTFIGFRALAGLVRRGVRKAVTYSDFSHLLRSTIVRLSGGSVMLVGFFVILTQLGVQVAPLLAGLGVAGVVVGFAMQNTLSNFAAGGMILGNQPYDVGDEIEAAGVVGIVKRMTLVCTTILTADNQTLIVPNSSIWGGVIRNRTAQPTRRVDLVFGIGYGDDLEKAERVLREIVAGQSDALEHPAPVIKLDRLADSSVNYVVRVWTSKERYQDVYWDLTRAVKLRFDQEGISIPFPQRELHMNLVKARTEDAAVTLGASQAPSA